MSMLTLIDGWFYYWIWIIGQFFFDVQGNFIWEKSPMIFLCHSIGTLELHTYEGVECCLYVGLIL